MPRPLSWRWHKNSYLMLLKNPGAKIPNMIGLAAELSGARLFIGKSIISKNKHKNSYLGFLQNPGVKKDWPLSYVVQGSV